MPIVPSTDTLICSARTATVMSEERQLRLRINATIRILAQEARRVLTKSGYVEIDTETGRPRKRL